MYCTGKIATEGVIRFDSIVASNPTQPRPAQIIGLTAAFTFMVMLPLDWIFLMSLSGGIVFAFVFAICTPGRLLFVSLFPSCPADHGPDRQPHFVFSRWIIIRLRPGRLM